MAHAARKKAAKPGKAAEGSTQAAKTKKAAGGQPIYTFRVGLAGLEDRIWRDIEVPSDYTLYGLAEFVLPLFGADSSYHMWLLRRDKTLYPQTGPSDVWGNRDEQDPRNVQLKGLQMVRGRSTMKLDYDMGSTSTFILRYTGRRALAEDEKEPAARLVDAHGADIIEDIGGYEIEDLVYRFDNGEELEDWDEDEDSMIPPGWDPDKLGEYAAALLNRQKNGSQ